MFDEEIEKCGNLNIYLTKVTSEFLDKKNAATDKEQGFWCVSVSDTGVGICEEIKDKIFDPFFTTKDPGEGTGVGLSISYNLIKEHKGGLIARNLDDGVVFEIYIPDIER